MDHWTENEPELYIPMALDYPIKDKTIQSKKLICSLKVKVDGLNKEQDLKVFEGENPRQAVLKFMKLNSISNANMTPLLKLVNE